MLWSRALWAQHKRNRAVQVMRTWVDKHPRDTPVSMQLAGAYLSNDQSSDALKTYEQVLEHSPSNIRALNNVAWLLRDQNLPRALSVAERAQQLAPNDPQVLDTMGMLLLRNGQTKLALSTLQQAAKIVPNDARIQLDLARALLKDDAKRDARRIVDPLLTRRSIQSGIGRERLEAVYG